MAENRIINKVVDYSNTYSQTLLDLTQDTVNRSNLERNQTAHDKEGEKITGALAIEDAEAWARGTRNGEPVTSEDETYHNNSKWYSNISGSIMQITGQMAQAAATSATNADYSEKLAQSYAKGDSGLPDRPDEETDNAEYFMTQAEASSIASGSSMRIAGVKASDAEAYADGTRDGQPVPSTDPTYQNNSKWYKEQCESIAGSLASVLKPKGTCLFADLPSIASSQPGDLWNIEDEFATTSDFREGAGKLVAAGADVYLTIDNKWDVLAGEAVKDMTGATATTDGTHGLIKQPHAGDQDKPFHGDGNYKYVVADKVVLSSAMTIGGQSQTKVEGSLRALNNTKQENLTFDNTPTQNSDNPVKSGGIYTELTKKTDYEITTPSLSAGSVNLTLYNPAITVDMKPRKECSTSASSAVVDLNVTTYDGYMTVTGSVSTATTVTITLYTPVTITNQTP